MGAEDLAAALAIGFAAGVASGMVGIGGGLLFVPALVIFLDQTALQAAATSLVGVTMVAAVGAWRQHGYENLRLGDGITVGALSPLGVVAGAALANTVPERALELGFAAVQLYFAYRLGMRALRDHSGGPAGDGAGSG